MSLPEIAAFKANPYGQDIRIDDVLENLEFLDDWEERYSYIIDLGKALPAFPDDQKTEQNYVHGCQSQVWLIHQQDPEDGKIYLLIDSDAIIVKGLAAIVMATLNALTPQEIIDRDVEAVFERMDLLRHISPTRGNGLRAMLDLVRSTAQQHL